MFQSVLGEANGTFTTFNIKWYRIFDRFRIRYIAAALH